jgi:bacillithiol biosynthesis cysteine-adding enzyme BshC
MSIFNKSAIILAETKAFDQLFIDYLANDEKTKNLFDFRPDLQGLQQKLAASAGRVVNRQLLISVLNDQYSFIKDSGLKESMIENISKLGSTEVFTICTGHQLNLFTGPLYTIFKIISTINASKALQEKTGKTILPIFWLASEDHDMEEINHFYIYGQRYEWKTDWKGASGRASCSGVEGLIEILRIKFGQSEFSTKWLDLLEAAFAESSNLAEATRKFLHALFGGYGLLILDPDDKRLKKEFIPEMIKDVRDHSAEKIIGRSIEKLNLHYSEQVHPRKVNLFYLTEDSRLRIDFKDEIFSLQDAEKTWTRSEIEKEISEYPERFSPNVVLRPLYQEKILPNLAMVGGPAEIAYWLEFKDFFQAMDVPFPVLLPRNNAMFIDQHSDEKLTRFKIEESNLFDSADEWIRTYFKEDPKTELSLDKSLAVIDEEFLNIASQVEQMDPTLKASVEAEQQKIRKVLKGFEEKVLRSVKKQNETEVKQIQKLHEKLFPLGKLQERTENVLPFIFNYDLAFIEELMNSMDPFKTVLNVFKEKK